LLFCFVGITHPPCFRGFIGKGPERPTRMVLWSWCTARRNQLASRSSSNFFEEKATGSLSDHDVTALALTHDILRRPLFNELFFDTVDGFMFTFSTRQENQGIQDVLGLLLAFSADQCSVN